MAAPYNLNGPPPPPPPLRRQIGFYGFNGMQSIIVRLENHYNGRRNNGSFFTDDQKNTAKNLLEFARTFEDNEMMLFSDTLHLILRDQELIPITPQSLDTLVLNMNKHENDLISNETNNRYQHVPGGKRRSRHAKKPRNKRHAKKTRKHRRHRKH